MEVFRIVREKYADKLIATGAANRWNREGDYVIYAGSSRSLATLELVVHKSNIKPVLAYKVMVITITDSDHVVTCINQKDLPRNWRSVAAYLALQKTGSDWYETKSTLLLKVPSAVIPREFNYIINSKHPDFPDLVSLTGVEDYFWDLRLFHSGSL